MSAITDGTGQGFKLRVNEKNQAHVFSESVSELEVAAREGRGYTVNAGGILTNDTENCIITFISDDEHDLILNGLQIVLGESDGAGNAEMRYHFGPVTTTQNTSNSTSHTSMRVGDAKQVDGTILGANAGGQTVTTSVADILLWRGAVDSFNSPTFLPFVYEQGASFALTLKAPTGNTSLEFFVSMTFVERSIT